MTQKKEFFGWFNSDKKFTEEQVKELIEQVKVFNAGCIDEYLSKHVDEVFKNWLAEYKK